MCPDPCCRTRIPALKYRETDVNLRVAVECHVFLSLLSTYTLVRAACEENIKVLDEWKEVCVSTNFDQQA